MIEFLCVGWLHPGMESEVQWIYPVWLRGRNWFFLDQRVSIAENLLVMVGPHVYYLSAELEPVQALCVLTVSVSSYVHRSCYMYISLKDSFPGVVYHQLLLQCFCLLFCITPSALRREVGWREPKVSHSLYIVCFWVSVLVRVYWKNKHIWWGLSKTFGLWVGPHFIRRYLTAVFL